MTDDVLRDGASDGTAEEDPRPGDAAPFLDALRTELVAAAARQVATRRRRRRTAVGGGAAALLASLVAVVALVLPTAVPASAGVVVRVRNGTITLTLEDLEHRPDRIEAAARAAGLAVRVSAVPVGPSHVGRFVGQATSGGLPPELRTIDQDGETFRGFALPEGWPGRLELLVGAPAGPGEAYAVLSDATAPGEPLACADLAGRPLGEVLGVLRRPGLRLRGLALDLEDERQPQGVADLAAPDRAAWRVLEVEAASSSELVVWLVPPSAPAPAHRPAGCRPEAGR
jgi:hypothetical protein